LNNNPIKGYEIVQENKKLNKKIEMLENKLASRQ